MRKIPSEYENPFDNLLLDINAKIIRMKKKNN